MEAIDTRPQAWPLAVSGLVVALTGSGTPVVADVSFSISQGEILGLVGESGSGKSTVGLALLAYAKPGLRIMAGSVQLGGLDMLSLDAKAVRDARGRLVSYVPQDPGSALNPARRIGAQLREALEVHRDKLADANIDERIGQLLDDVAIPRDILKRFPHQISGGQQQRIGIALAFACRPRLIVFDEPTTGLDVTSQAHILRTIRTLSQSYGVSGLYI
ncbi:MAG: ATP-binding cassette domain-containing protein, partial [bacterium]